MTLFQQELFPSCTVRRHKDRDSGASSAQLLHNTLENMGKQSPGVKPVAHFVGFYLNFKELTFTSGKKAMQQTKED